MLSGLTQYRGVGDCRAADSNLNFPGLAWANSEFSQRDLCVRKFIDKPRPYISDDGIDVVNVEYIDDKLPVRGIRRLGFALTRRNYAAAFNVDIYSRNEYLQKELNEISRAGFLGETLVRIGSVAVGGAAGMALSVTGDVEALNELLRRKSAGELRAFIELTSKKMGVGDDVIELFIENCNYTITQQVALMLALESMDETTNRAAFVKFSALVDNADMAGFRRRQAEMYATYNEAIDPLSAFQILGQVAFGRTADGDVLFAAQLDHMLWTNDLAQYVRWVDDRINALEDVDSKRFWTAALNNKLAPVGKGRRSGRVYADNQTN